MFTLIRGLSPRQLLTEQAPPLVLSLAIAEIAYKFHSFLLEAAAFLATWYVLDGVRHLIGVRLSSGDASATSAQR